jgi:hypothetical protein
MDCLGLDKLPFRTMLPITAPRARHGDQPLFEVGGSGGALGGREIRRSSTRHAADRIASLDQLHVMAETGQRNVEDEGVLQT